MTDHTSASDLDLLPPVLRVVAAASGIAGALRLVEFRGGVPVYVPQEARPDHELVPHIGIDGLRALCATWPAETVIVPMAAAALRAIRDRRMLADRKTRSIRDLSLTYKLHRRRVQQIMARGCGQLAEDQDDLFS